MSDPVVRRTSVLHSVTDPVILREWTKRRPSVQDCVAGSTAAGAGNSVPADSGRRVMDSAAATVVDPL